MQDDNELVRLVQGGNQQAYARLVDKYKGKIFARLYRMIGQKQDAQDLAQEVFTKAYFQLEKLEPDGNFSAWLYRIAINHCLDELRKRKRSVKTSDEEGQRHRRKLSCKKSSSKFCFVTSWGWKRNIARSLSCATSISSATKRSARC